MINKTILRFKCDSGQATTLERPYYVIIGSHPQRNISEHKICVRWFLSSFCCDLSWFRCFTSIT